MNPQPSPIDLPERRRLHRYALATPLVATLNGHGVSLVDLSLRGARVRHSRAFTLGECRLRFRWENLQFDDLVQIVASSAIPAETITFESRIRFAMLSHGSDDVIKRAVTTLHERTLARWLANLRGDHDEQQPSARASSGFIAYVLNSGKWRRHRVAKTDSELQNGFVVRASVPPGEVRQLCAAFEQTDAEGRALLKVLAMNAE